MNDQGNKHNLIKGKNKITIGNVELQKKKYIYTQEWNYFSLVKAKENTFQKLGSIKEGHIVYKRGLDEKENIQ